MDNRINYVNIAASCYLLMLTENGVIKSTTVAVGLALASFIDGRTMSTTIDKRRLAKRAGISRETLRKQLRILESIGFLTITDRTGRSNKYTITLPENKESTMQNPAHNPAEPLPESSPLTRQENRYITEHRPKTY